ncbi:mitochondrial carrier domain-containing protein [Chytriomyces cf. hyalinus JEL632]|nr:mitochondrial carrier domain-containing protein [Chytriomyces cf. hyalinus JEL632]
MVSPTQEPKSQLATHARGFIVGAIAACGAVTITNPMEVAKTRLQLQGELSKTAAAAGVPRQYNGALHAFIKIAQNEGLRGIQRGLAPGYWYQAIMNGTRLGFYEPVRNVMQGSIDALAGVGAGTTGVGKVACMIASGASCGMFGAFLGSPLFLVKTRMQSYSPSMAVGAQHSYVTGGMIKSLIHIYKNEGIPGLWRGADAAMIRTGVGSAVQLSTYDASKETLLKSGWFKPAGKDGSISLHFAASAFTSLFVCIAMNPFDVIMTRMYNQNHAKGGQGAMYASFVDCFAKTVRTEGPLALYKGFSAHYLRIGPHTILTFVFLEQVKKAASKILD